MKSVFNKIKNSFTKKVDTIDVALVTQRFVKLFHCHGVERSQIPRLFSKVSLKDLNSEGALIEKLTPDLLDEAATLFNVRSEWLDGVDDEIYQFSSYYKQPKEFFDFFSRINIDTHSCPVRLLTCADSLDYKSRSSQKVLLVVLEKVAELAESNIYRYHLDSEWDWAHSPCRLQLKAMTKILFISYGLTVPIFKTSREQFQLVADLSEFPSPYVNGPLCTNPSLEDYVLKPEYSAVAKETEELSRVDEYIEEHQLSSLLLDERPHKVSEENESRDADADEAISKMNSKNAKAKYLRLDKHKEEFKQFFIDKEYKNKSQAARDYFTSLSIQGRKVVVPTYYENDHDNGLLKAVRTLTTSLRK